MFTSTSQELGTLYPGVQVTIDFPYDEKVNITKFVSPCDCSTPYDMKDQKLVRVKYTPKEIPIHLLAAGRFEMPIMKQVTVYYTLPGDPGVHEQKLFFKGVVRKKQ